MIKVDFNNDWAFKRLNADDSCVLVNLPHDAMLGEKRSMQNQGGKNIGWFSGGDYEYTKTFTLPPAYADKEVYLEFEGIYRNAEIYVNGKLAATRPCGYSSIYVTLNPFIHKSGENEIRVIARNSDQPNSRWYTGSGIYRPAYLYVAEAEHIKLNGIKIQTVGLNPPTVEVGVQTTDGGNITIEILDGDKIINTQHVDADETCTIELPYARLWSAASPNLYRLRCTYQNDSIIQPFGIRLLHWNAQEGFTVNTEREILRGACVHHDNGLLGACCYPQAEERRIRLLKENGFNAIRSAHNPCSKAMLDACDRLGMYVIDEYADMWYTHKTQYDYASYLPEWWKRDLGDMVEKCYNHPSVIMYSIGNEVSETAQERGITLTHDMTQYLHELDSTRPVTCGVNIFFNYLSSIGFGVYTDKKAEKNTGAKKKAVGSEFYNNIAGLLGDKFMKFGATWHGSDMKTKNAFAMMDIAGYNYGIKRYRMDLRKYPQRLILGSETFCSDTYTFWKLAKTQPRIIGDFNWAGMDYIGETALGAWEYADYAPPTADESGWLTAGSGRINIIGRPLAEAAYMKTAYELTHEPVIAVRPVNHTRDRHSPSSWKMTNAMTSWAWNGCEGNPAIVEVYARAATAQLFVNGKSVGTKRFKNDCRVIFKTTYHDGEISVITYDESGNKIGNTRLATAQNETVLQAIPEITQAAPGDLCYILLQYTDSQGILKPLERGKLSVQVAGGELLGLGHACPYNPDGYLNHSTDTYYGEAMAIVRAGEADRVVLKVTDGRYRDEVSIPCKLPNNG